MSDVELEIEWVHKALPWPIPCTVPVGGHVVLFGYAVKESTGLQVAELDLFDGVSVGGASFLPLPLQAGEAAIDWFGPQGVHFRGGLFPNVAAGAVAGQLFIATPPWGDNRGYGR